MGASVRFERILGVRFAAGDCGPAIDRICREGGLVVMPSGPALTLLSKSAAYREALLEADLALPDSALMVLTWNLTRRGQISKLSGLRYLRALIGRPEFRLPGLTMWVMPSESSARCNVRWLRESGVPVADQEIYLAPIYGTRIEDFELLRRIEVGRPRHVFLGLAGGKQEQLGLFLKRNLSYKPAIHCIGAAIAFLSGDQVRIPACADRAGLGWLWRIAANPAEYFPRYCSALRVVPTMLRYGDRLPATDDPGCSGNSAAVGVI